MQDWIETVIAFIAANRQWAGPIVGALAFIESLAFVGMLVPGTALMLAVGSMIGLGIIHPVPVLACAVAGAILGDWLSYAIGRRIGPSAYRRWPLNRHREGVARARLFFRRYGFAAILLGRFLGPVRATIPIVAGVMAMPRRTFQLANILSAIIWVPALLVPGFFAARSLGPVQQVTEMHVLGLGLIVAVATLGGTLIGAKILGKRKRRGGKFAR